MILLSSASVCSWVSTSSSSRESFLRSLSQILSLLQPTKLNWALELRASKYCAGSNSADSSGERVRSLPGGGSGGGPKTGGLGPVEPDDEDALAQGAKGNLLVVRGRLARSSAVCSCQRSVSRSSDACCFQERVSLLAACHVGAVVAWNMLKAFLRGARFLLAFALAFVLGGSTSTGVDWISRCRACIFAIYLASSSL